MSLKYIRKSYNVPAFRGQKITYTPLVGKQKSGHITSSKGAYLKIKFDGDNKTHPGVFHPQCH